MDGLGQRIKKLRTKAHLTQQELAAIAGIHSSNIGRIEKGQIRPTADVLFKIASYFDIPSDFLLTGELSSTDDSFKKNIGLLEKYLDLPADFLLTEDFSTADSYFKNCMDLIKKFNALSTDNQREILDFIDFKLMQQSDV